LPNQTYKEKRNQMPRITGTRERRHHPIYDSLLHTTGAPTTTLQPTTKLFGSGNVGDLAKTNMQIAGVLAADQTFIIMALRCYMHFAGTNDVVLFQQVSNQLVFTLTLGDKPMFTCPSWFIPAGGGNYGASEITNGIPTQEAVLRLGRPIVIPVRQNISVDATFYALGTTNAVTTINGAANDDEMSVKYFIDGIQTRDVQ
jgi:hypothetical protein